MSAVAINSSGSPIMNLTAKKDELKKRKGRISVSVRGLKTLDRFCTGKKEPKMTVREKA